MRSWDRGWFGEGRASGWERKVKGEEGGQRVEEKGGLVRKEKRRSGGGSKMDLGYCESDFS